jgi:16S rRNA processing protein RimM
MLMASLSTSNSLTELPALLEVGRILKPHGLKGELIVDLITDRTERVATGSVLSTDRGDLTVRAARRHQDKWIVLFDGFSDRAQVESWRGVSLRAAPIDPLEGELFIHELIGARVIDAAGNDRGEVREVLSNPASDLLVLDSGALVPLRFVVGDPVDGTIRVDTPDGLFELYEPES